MMRPGPPLVAVAKRKRLSDAKAQLDAKSDNAKVASQQDSPVSITAAHAVDNPPTMSLPKAHAKDEELSWQDEQLTLHVWIVVPILVAVAPIFAMVQWGGLADAILTAEVQWGVLTAGFLAQIVDGSLGMGYGITSTSVLTSCGLSPTIASTAVHIAQLGTTAVSGYAHRRCGHVDSATMSTLTPAGAIGALLGSTLLSSLATSTSKLLSSGTLLAVGLYVVYRFSTARPSSAATTSSIPRHAFLIPLGLVGGCIDAMGGGGWGPVATSGLLAEGRLAPARVIGTTSLSEFFVTVAAVVGFLLTLHTAQGTTELSLTSASTAFAALRIDLALTLLAGGLLAAPIAPFLVQRIPAGRLGILVGCFICATNMRALRAALAA